MTLDIEKFISNSIKSQAKIQHLEIKTKTTKNVPPSVKDLIAKDYGDKYLLDADYVSFFWGAITKDEIKKLFNVVDKALGKSANKLTETDFKKISFESASDKDIEDAAEEQVEDDESASDEDSPAEDVDDEEVDIEVEEEPEDDGGDEDEEDDEEDDELDEDDESDAVQEPPKKTSYFFLKITMK